jgi:[ribosomal protein S5]-alanine N-acetyltransferase
MTAADHDALADMIFDPQVVAYLRYRRVQSPAAFEQLFTTHFWQTRPLFLALNVAVIIN